MTVKKNFRASVKRAHGPVDKGRLWVDLGDSRQPEAQFSFQAISGTYSVPIFSRD